MNLNLIALKYFSAGQHAQSQLRRFRADFTALAKSEKRVQNCAS